jgi:hypothetical protein
LAAFVFIKCEKNAEWTMKIFKAIQMTELIDIGQEVKEHRQNNQK